MKHTDFYAMIEAVKHLEIKELKQAVRAHEGSYEWGEDDEKPIVAINPDNSAPEPMDVEITKVYFRDDNLQVEGVSKYSGEDEEFTLDDIFAGHISYIIEMIPETDLVKDVTTGTSSRSSMYALVQFPEDTSYFEENNIGYPSFESEDNGARYVSEDDYIKFFGHKPNGANLYKPICWPESQIFQEDPKLDTYSEPINDEKGMEDYGSLAYWIPLCYCS